MHHCTCADETSGTVDLSLLDPVLERYADEAGALIPVLQQAQEVYGYLPKPVLAAIASARHVPFSEVYGVTTFYSQFHLEPRGKTIVKICHGTACHVAGAPEITHAITDELMTKVGETSEDLRFTVEAVACVGCCGLAPVVVVGEETHGQLDPGCRPQARQADLPRSTSSEQRACDHRAHRRRDRGDPRLRGLGLRRGWLARGRRPLRTRTRRAGSQRVGARGSDRLPRPVRTGPRGGDLAGGRLLPWHHAAPRRTRSSTRSCRAARPSTPSSTARTRRPSPSRATPTSRSTPASIASCCATAA